MQRWRQPFQIQGKFVINNAIALPGSIRDEPSTPDPSLWSRSSNVSRYLDLYVGDRNVTYRKSVYTHTGYIYYLQYILIGKQVFKQAQEKLQTHFLKYLT